MSEFSYVLSRHIHQKNIKTYALAQYCGIDRSNMYKIINGKRKPTSLEMVHKMARFMHLSPAEELELDEAYQITLTGYDNYFRRKNVMDFFTGFNLSTASLPSFKYKAEQSIVSQESTLLTSSLEVKKALFHIISAEMGQQTEGYIRLLLQPDASFLINLIHTECQADTKVHIEHIICLNNNSEKTQLQKNYNLNCLKQILPLCGSCPHYKCFYYYDDISARTGKFTLFPYMVITSECVCLLTAELDKGYIIRSENACKVFSDMFINYRKASTLLLNQISNVTEQLTFVTEFLHEYGPSFCFQMTPCFTPFLTLSMLEKYITMDIMARSEFISYFHEYIKNMKAWQEQGKTYCIFSYEGVRHFLETGKINEYPEDIYRSFDMHDRLILIRKLIQECKNERYRMLKEPIGNVEHELYLFINQQSGYLMFSSPHTGEPVYLNIEEPGLLFTFYDFCENLDDSMFYMPEETEIMINELLKNK